MGCLRKIGCLTVLLIGAAVAIWYYRDRLFGDRDKASAGAPAGPKWEPLTPAGAARARETVRVLGQPRGPVFANLKGADLSAFVFDELSKEILPSAENVEAAVIGDQLHVRARVKVSDFGDVSTLGPLAALLGDREPVQFGGTLRVLRPGLAEYRVTSLRIRELTIPTRLIPRLIRSIDRSSRPEGVSADALPLEVPAYVADVRIQDGKVILYKRVQ